MILSSSEEGEQELFAPFREFGRSLEKQKRYARPQNRPSGERNSDVWLRNVKESSLDKFTIPMVFSHYAK